MTSAALRTNDGCCKTKIVSILVLLLARWYYKVDYIKSVIFQKCVQYHVTCIQLYEPIRPTDTEYRLLMLRRILVLSSATIAAFPQYSYTRNVKKAE